MKTMKYCYEKLKPLANLNKLTEIDDVLYFDIETTGLSRKNNHIYLIGCGYYSSDGLNIIQWFAENADEEYSILKQFNEFSSSFACLVNYNGKSFDIPFTKERMKKYNLCMPEFKSVDIYTYVKPLKKILSLNDLTQKTVESFLNIKRLDIYNGGELISVYKKWCSINATNCYLEDISNEAETCLHNLLLHNKEDVLNMHYITKILDYDELLNSKIFFDKYVINEYTDYSGTIQNEIILYATHNVTLPKGYKSFYNNSFGSFIMNVSENGNITIRIPIVKCTLNYYISNYKDYYYLPNEDICILKSMASGVSKENKINATKETCKVKLNDKFVPFINCINGEIKIFKDSIKAKDGYIRLSDFECMKTNELDIYINTIYKTFM